MEDKINVTSIYLSNARKIKKWMEDRNSTKSPACTAKDPEERKLGIALQNIKRNLIKPYESLRTDKEKEEYRKVHPEIENVIEIVNWINNNKVPQNLINARKIKGWMKDTGAIKPPSSISKNEEEKKIGMIYHTMKGRFINPYKSLKTEQEKRKYEAKHPEIVEVIEIMNWVEEHTISPYLINARKIKEWMDNKNAINPPSAHSEDQEEQILGRAYQSIKGNLIFPYEELETEDEKEKYKEKYPGIDEIVEIINWVKEHTISQYLFNARIIKKWMDDRNTTKPPSMSSKNEEEKKLGSAISTIRRLLIKPYNDLKTEKERAEYKKQHPELEEVMSIIENIDKNNLPIKLVHAREIKKWMDETKPENTPTPHSKDPKTQEMGVKLKAIRQHFIKPYLELETIEEKEKFREEHPEIDEIMQIVSEAMSKGFSTRNMEFVELIKQDIQKRAQLEVKKEEKRKIDEYYKEQLLRQAKEVEEMYKNID